MASELVILKSNNNRIFKKVIIKHFTTMTTTNVILALKISNCWGSSSDKLR